MPAVYTPKVAGSGRTTLSQATSCRTPSTALVVANEVPLAVAAELRLTYGRTCAERLHKQRGGKSCSEPAQCEDVHATSSE